jgi:hypothetical protein
MEGDKAVNKTTSGHVKIWYTSVPINAESRGWREKIQKVTQERAL